MNDALSGSVNIGMVSRDITSSEVSQGIVYVSVVKDAVLATMSTDNPYLSNITKTGITKEQFRAIFINHTITTWGQLINDSSVTTLIKVYSRSDLCGAAETWAKYLGNYTQDDFPTAEWLTKLKGDDLMATTVKGDPNGIGYSNVNYIYDTTTKLPLDKLIPVPIDINGNGTIDPEENFYTNRDNVVTAEISGALPSPPTRVINLVTKGNFTGATNDFVYWILTAGQNLVFENGYSPLSDNVIQEQIAILGR